MAQKKQRSYKQLTEENFRQIKALANASLSNAVIRDITGRSSSTINWIRKADSLEDYHVLVRNYTNSRREKLKREKAGISPLPMTLDEVFPSVAKEVVDLPTVDEPALTEAELARTVEPNTLDRIASALERQARATERLADAWETTPRKKFF